MRTASNGLQRDLNLMRRRAWVFIPFFIFGILAAVAFGRIAGQSNAVATMQLETAVFDSVPGGDRGFRIFEAQSMTQDKAFKDEVLKATGLPEADYARYAVALAPISVADGVSRGTLTVSIKDESKATAERLRNAFALTYAKEYTAEDGLFRTRFIKNQEDVLAEAEANYRAALEQVKPVAQALNTSVEELIRSKNAVRTSLMDELNTQAGALRAELAQLNAVTGTPTGAMASAALGRPVTDAEAGPAIAARRQILDAALKDIEGQRFKLSDAALSHEQQRLVDTARSQSELRTQASLRLASVRAAIVSAQSSIETTYSFSGGVAGTTIGRVGVVIAVTLVFGVIAIYLIEWLSILRRGPEQEA